MPLCPSYKRTIEHCLLWDKMSRSTIIGKEDAMKKNIMIINADREAAQIVKDNLACPSTNILCVSSMHEALLSFMDKEFCLVRLEDRRIGRILKI